MMVIKNVKIRKFIAGITVFLLPLLCITSAFAAPIIPTAPEAPGVVVSVPTAPLAPVPPAPETNQEQSVVPLVESLVNPISTAEAGAPAITGNEDPTLIVNPGVSSIGSVNTNTGNQSLNQAALTLGMPGQAGTNQTNITNQADAVVDNMVVLSADSANNEANYNTGNGTVESGEANIVLSILNFINTVFIAPNGGQISLIFDKILGDLVGDYIIDPSSGEAYSLTGSRLDVENSNTGAESLNNAYINLGNSTNISNVNDGTANNNIALNANTGGNSSSYNTGSGSVASGDANVSLNLLNFLNSTFLATGLGMLGVLNVFGDLVGNIVIPQQNLVAGQNDSQPNINVVNENTGANSENNAEITVNNGLDVDNDNVCDISNEIALAGNSGNNLSGYNTGNGEVTSGDVNTNLGVNNVVNQNMIGDTIIYTIVNVLGKWTGSNLLANMFNSIVIPNPSGNGQSIIIKNSNTGANSLNNANVNIENKTEISNKNTAGINNSVSVNADTGNNSASYNTGNGSVSSGNVNILANVLNLANINVVANKFMFFVINIFGDWNGDIADHGSNPEDDENDDNSSNDVDNTNNTPPSDGIVLRRPVFASSGTGFTFSQASYVSTLETEPEDVLAANSDFYEFNGSENDEYISPFMKFLSENIWNILLILGTVFILFFIFLYARQRKINQMIH